MANNNELSKETIIEIEKLARELENSPDRTSTIKAFLEKKSIDNSTDIAKEITKEYNRIKAVKTLNDISSRVLDSIPKAEMMEYFGRIMNVINHGNRDIKRAATTISGEINMNPSLHGFLFEKIHAAVFNANAAAKKSPLRAVIPRPKGGYAKNSVDIYIINKNNKHYPLQRYQAKCCSDADATIRAVRNGNYNNQRLLVPEPQAKAVQTEFPNKTVTDRISYNGIESNPITHSQVKDYQDALQNGYDFKLDLGIVDTKTYARACAELMRDTIIIDGGVHLATGIATEALSGQFDAKRFIGNTVGATAEDALVLGLSAATIVGLVELGVKITSKEIPYVIDIVRGTYNIGKTIVLMAMNKITIEAGLAQITEEIATTALIVGGSALGAKVGFEIGVRIGADKGALIGTAVGTIVGGMLGGITGNVVKSETEGAVKEFFENVAQKILENFNVSDSVNKSKNILKA